MKAISNDFKIKNQALAVSIALTAITGVLMPVWANATVSLPENANIGGTAYLTYDQAAWSTMRSGMYRTDIHGGVLNDGAFEPTSDTSGNRFLYPQLFKDHTFTVPVKPSGLASETKIADGTADPEAVAQWRIFNRAEMVPAAQPAKGYAMEIDPLTAGTLSGWASGYAETAMVHDETFGPLISLGGSIRMHSDFIAPGGTLWFNNLDVREEGGIWYLGSSAYLPSHGGIFELVDPVFGINAQGQLTLDADYKWGNTAWSNFLGFNLELDNPNSDGNKVLGHISFNSPVPVPGAIWFFGSALLGLVSIKRRKAFA